MRYQLLPSLTPDEYAALREDIAAHGIRVPIDVDESGAVLDGHHRQAIAAELGIDCPTRVVPGLSEPQKRQHALVVNTARRQLTQAQRREVLAASITADPDLSDREHARRIGCSPSTVGAVRRELSGQVSNLDTHTEDDAHADIERIRQVLDTFARDILDDLLDTAKSGRNVADRAGFWRGIVTGWSSSGVIPEDAAAATLALYVERIDAARDEVLSIVAEAQANIAAAEGGTPRPDEALVRQALARHGIDRAEPWAVLDGGREIFLPSMTSTEFQRLCESVRSRGVREPCPVVVEPDGTVTLLDGRMRLCAALVVGTTAPLTTMAGDDGATLTRAEREAFMWTCNMERKSHTPADVDAMHAAATRDGGA